MKVTIFLGSLYGGGAERVSCNLANYLVKNGHHVDMLTMAESDKNYGLLANVTNTILLKNDERSNTVSNSVKRLERLKYYLKNHETDCYIVMMPITTIMLLSLKKYTTAAVIAAERVDPSTYPKIKQILLKRTAKRADKFIFQTDIIRKWYGDCIDKNKAVIIPNAINEGFIRAPFAGIKQKTIVSAGRLTDQKNHRLLLDAFAQLHKSFPDYTLCIYGDGPLKGQLLEQAKQLGISDAVEFPGNVQDIASHIESASMFVLSSKFEGMPNALMEAMALGLPCVSTDCGGGGARFLIKDGENGFLVPNNDADALGNAMIKVISDKDLAKMIGDNACKITDELAPNRIYGIWEKCISEVVGE